MKKIFFITELIILGWFVYFILLGIDYAVSGSMNTNNIFFDFLGGKKLWTFQNTLQNLLRLKLLNL